jgi:hypothetical protein
MKFLLQNLGLFGSVIETLACMVGFLCWHKLRKTFGKFIPFYLLWISTAEWIGLASAHYKWAEINQNLYNFLVSPSEFLFWFWLFHQLIKIHDSSSRLAMIFAVLFIVGVGLDSYFFVDKSYAFLSFSNSIGTIFLLALSLVFFYHTLNSDHILTFPSSLQFWITVPVFSYYLLSFPLYGMWNTLSGQHLELFLQYRIMVICLSITMYLSFIIGFIWGKTK